MTRYWQTVLDAAGPVAASIQGLWWLLFVVCTLVYIAVMGALLFALIRRGSSENERRKTFVISLSVAVTVLVLFVFAVASFQTGRAISDVHAAGAPTIYVTAQQWWWEVVYADAEPGLRVTSANELHLPVGRKVKLELRSADVIHSFWVPNLSGKRDMIPGRVTAMWLQADRTAVFRAQCAEFCGLQHAHMAFPVIVQSGEDYDRWLVSQRKLAIEPVSDTQKRGQRVFLEGTCVICHSIRGIGAFASVAPDLTHFGSRYTIAAGTLPNERVHLGRWIADPQSVKPGSRMPPVRIPKEDVDPLLDYLESLR